MEYIGSGIALIVGTVVYNYRQRIASVFKSKQASSTPAAPAPGAGAGQPNQTGGAKLRKKRTS